VPKSQTIKVKVKLSHTHTEHTADSGVQSACRWL